MQWKQLADLEAHEIAVADHAKPPPMTGGVRVAGDSHVGKVRTTNEDSLVVEPARNLYAVFDGMGGANAGDVAWRTRVRDAITEYIAPRRGLEPKLLLEQALQHSCHAVFSAAQANRDHAGDGHDRGRVPDREQQPRDRRARRR